MNIEIVFIGSSAIGLQKLSQSKRFNVIDVLCLKKKVNHELENATCELGLKIKTFNWINDFEKLINKYESSTRFFIYQLDMLVPANLTNKYDFFNIHRGNLKTNRGMYPDIWTVLLGFKTTKISLHKINDKIDLGLLIDAHKVEISKDDDSEKIKRKLERGIPKLIESLHLFLNDKIQGKEIKEGVYRPRIIESDFTINPFKDSIEIMKRKIKSQVKYNGAIIYYDGKKKYVTSVSCSKPTKTHAFLKIKNGNTNFYFIENKKPKYSAPPKFQSSKRIN